MGLEVYMPPTFSIDVEGTASKVNSVPSGGYLVTITCSLNRTVGDRSGDQGSATERRDIIAAITVGSMITFGSLGSCPDGTLCPGTDNTLLSSSPSTVNSPSTALSLKDTSCDPSNGVPLVSQCSDSHGKICLSRIFRVDHKTIKSGFIH